MHRKDTREMIDKSFKLFDDDQTGRISFRNLKRVAAVRRWVTNPPPAWPCFGCASSQGCCAHAREQELGENMSEEDIMEMLAFHDKDGDGAVSKAEFHEEL